MNSSIRSEEERSTIRNFVAGYEWRKAEYLAKLEEIRCTIHSCRHGGIHENKSLDKVEQAAQDVLFTFEQKVNSKIYHALEWGRSYLVGKYGDRQAGKLFNAIWLNCKNRRDYPYHALERALGVGYCKRQFVNIKNKFLDVICDYLEEK